jgi:quinone-modifying oxidoreductase subunit QmoC
MQLENAMMNKPFFPSSASRQALMERGGEAMVRCFQCGTCSAVCDLASEQFNFPRRQIHMAQMGMLDELAADPAIWLCHQCNDCSLRCPQDARPGDVLQVVRAKMIENLSVPGFMGSMVANVRRTWPMLIGVPILFFVVLLGLTGNLDVPSAPFPHGEFAYELFVPHSLIYAVFFPVAAFVMWALWSGGRRYWESLDGAEKRRGSLLTHLWPVLREILLHERFSKCTSAAPRKQGHLPLVLGFIGAAATSGLLIVAIYLLHATMPLSLLHPFKLLGNLSAILLVAGVLLLILFRMKPNDEGGSGSTAFDLFFLTVVALVVFTGVVTEAGRFVLPLGLSCGIYVVHLGVVLTLFLTCPYSKFAHFIYRTLAMLHERMVG